MASAVGGALEALQQPGTKTSNPKGQLKVEDFIKMMVTQLQNQDPMEPAKNEQLLAQMSQIGQLQSQQDLQSSLKTMVLQNNIGSASNMIGKSVQGVDESTGETIDGKVQTVQVVNGNVMLQLEGGISLPMNKITSITEPQADLAKAVQSSANATVAP